MKYNNFLQRLRHVMPKHITPKFQNYRDLLEWNQKQGKLFAKSIIEKIKKKNIQNALKLSGIKALYANCSFENYKIEHEGHQKVVTLAKQYAYNFSKNINSFMFLGKPGTGKNHLASAISHHLILQNKKVVLITITELMSIIKSTFNHIHKKWDEKNFINYFSTIDLLILDEIGIQTESKYEKIIINQIIENRSSSKKPTGILSNLNYNSIIKTLGERIIDRIKLGRLLKLNFSWNSYRQKVC